MNANYLIGIPSALILIHLLLFIIRTSRSAKGAEGSASGYRDDLCVVSRGLEMKRVCPSQISKEQYKTHDQRKIFFSFIGRDVSVIK